MSDDLEEFYAATYSRLVGQVSLVTSNRAEAEEVVQEAFVRLLPRWKSVSAYDDPEAWVRRVAMRITTSRWRRAKVAASHLAHLAGPEATPGPDGVGVDLERALAAIPRAHRQVVVLHHVVGLPVDHIARELGVPAGTVKSRLSRARTALAHLLREEVLA